MVLDRMLANCFSNSSISGDDGGAEGVVAGIPPAADGGSGMSGAGCGTGAGLNEAGAGVIGRGWEIGCKVGCGAGFDS
ncbi:MAG: hypothetical protein QME74_06670 [Candidatus Edwardsbacteria bacterium]|nr:hypothetical protein [Candidatus Edwardsbacteria bacterium]